MKKKKLTEEQIGEVIGKLADEVRSQIDFDFRVKRGHMHLAENDLVNTFTPEQMALYKEYCEKREEFYAVANELYVRRF